VSEPAVRSGSIREADEEAIAEAADILRRGGLVSFPTETVYGLGAAARDEGAVRRIFEAKGRPADHPVIVHVGDAAHLARWSMAPPPEAERLAAAFWPGALTLVLRRAPDVSDAVTGGADTVGLRMPDHPVAIALLKRFGDGIAAPSANRFGRISPTRAQHVAQEFGDDVELILDGGPCRIGVESTIVDLSSGTPSLLRPGGVRLEAIEQVLGRTLGAADAHAPRAPGMLASHYAPHTPTVAMPRAMLEASASPDDGVLAFDNFPGDVGRHRVVLPAQPERAAHGLYEALRALDAAGTDRILVEVPPDTPEWRTVRDRIFRAAALR